MSFQSPIAVEPSLKHLALRSVIVSAILSAPFRVLLVCLALRVSFIHACKKKA